jgi:hypothetical protein
MEANWKPTNMLNQAGTIGSGGYPDQRKFQSDLKKTSYLKTSDQDQCAANMICKLSRKDNLQISNQQTVLVVINLML